MSQLKKKEDASKARKIDKEKKSKKRKRNSSTQTLKSSETPIDNLRKAAEKGNKNCLFCKRFRKCDNPGKSFKSVCDRFKTIRINTKEKLNLLKNGTSKSPKEYKDFNEMESTKVFIKQIDKAISDFKHNPLPIDLKIDDRDLPLAANFIEFCSPAYLNVEPRAKQAEIAIHTLAEYCPDCSDTKYVNDIPLNDSIDKIKERVVLLEHGVCPKCQRNKTWFFKKGKLKVPAQMAGLAGQRCVTGNTWILTENGYIRIKDLQPSAPQGLSPYTGPALIMDDGKSVMPTNFYCKDGEETIELTLSNGLKIKGRPQHPIQIYDLKKDRFRYKKLKNIKSYDLIHAPVGMDKWGSSTKIPAIRKIAQDQLPNIMKLDKESSRKFILSLFSEPKNVSVGNLSAAYVTFSEPVAEAVSLILSNFGVHNRVCKLSYLAKTLTCVVIMGIEAVNAFIENIGDVKRSDYFLFDNMRSTYENSGSLMRLSSYNYPLGIRRKYISLLKDLNDKIYPKFLKLSSVSKSRKKSLYIRIFHTLFGKIPHQTKEFFKELEEKRLSIHMTKVLRGEIKAIIKYENSTSVKKLFKPLLAFFKKIKTLTDFVELKASATTGKETVYDFQVPDYNQFIGNGIVNHNSGKTALSKMICGYGYHRYLKLPNGNRSYGVLENEILYSQLIAITWKQSKELLYDGIYEYLTGSPWFKQYNEMMKYYGEKYGEELFKIKDTFAFYKHKLLYIAPYGPDKRKLRGRTGYLGAIDELSWLVSSGNNEDNMVKINGEEIYTALNNTFDTLRPYYYSKLKEGNYNLPPPLLLCTSSPTSKKDMTCRLVEIGKTSNMIYSYQMCVSGDTKLTTEEGIKRIDEIVTTDSDSPVSVPIDLTILGKDKKAKAVAWHYTGKKELFKVKTESGHFVKASDTHRVLVLRNGVHEWVETKNLTLDDYLCVNLNSLTRKKKLALNLIPASSLLVGKKRTDLIKIPSRPKYMTPEIAFLLAGIIAEGWFSEKLGKTVVSNNIHAYLDAVDKGWEQFGRAPTRVKCHPKGTYISHMSSVIMPKWLKDLGLVEKGSYHKEIPWSIMQADEKSQLSFLASYIEADGWITKDKIGISSRSKKLLKQMKLLLQSHGVMTIPIKFGIHCASKDDAFTLYHKIRPYLTFKYSNYYAKPFNKNRGYKFPVHDILNNIRKRKLEGHTTDCLNDNGDIVCLTGTFYQKQSLLRSNVKHFTYNDVDSGYWNGCLNDIKLVSKTEYNKIAEILKTRYYYTKITSIKSIGFKKTYDLTMDTSVEPAFTANGIVIHNSTWEMNPHIPRESLEDKFKLNYIKAMRDFGAVPPNSLKPYIESLEVLKSLVSRKRRNAYRVKHNALIMPNGSERTCAKVYFNTPPSNINHALSIDAGYSNNSFAITTGYYDVKNESPVVDGIVEVIPIDSNTPISFNAVYTDVICPIIETMNITLVVTDRWQNLKLLSDLETNYGVTVVTHSPKYKLFDQFRTDIEILENILPNVECKWNKIETLGQVDYPLGFVNNPVAHLLYQMVTVQDVQKDVTKGDGTTDDIFRSFINLYQFLCDEEYRDLVSGGSIEEAAKHALGVWGSQGSGGKGGGSMSYAGIGLVAPRK